MKYIFTQLEEDIRDFYHTLSITNPHEIDMYHIANTFDIWIEYENEKSDLIETTNGMFTISLDNRLTTQEQWQDFGHEFGHYVKHVGKQHKLRKHFRDLQEYQADNFMYQFCVPTFMLFNYQTANYLNIESGITFVSEKFNVTEEFAKNRLIHYRNQLMQAKADEEHRMYMETLYPKAPPYSKETNRILAQLHRQLTNKSK
ncbi:ImmA/IrrE family metallo-endopeptidase [Bacillus massiliigorillae]|uniref:ImmA/IrrE family metallo-endopeptidase n=1 Tax=Bacillus massiliigorillae TaxID=1243664 RepID=UPI0003A40648|nr:ImmA/IrrE family metallo-endopeptidase [Bacillus massiliigorillae]